MRDAFFLDAILLQIVDKLVQQFLASSDISEITQKQMKYHKKIIFYIVIVF